MIVGRTRTLRCQACHCQLVIHVRVGCLNITHYKKKKILELRMTKCGKSMPSDGLKIRGNEMIAGMFYISWALTP